MLTWPLAAWFAAELLVVVSDLPHADAIVVLSGSTAYVERTERAAQLFREGRAPLVILTNDGLRGPWSATRHDNPSYAQLAADELERHGVAPDRIRIVPEVAIGGTYVEALRFREYASTHRLKSVLVVTSAYHARRALWTMHQVLNQGGIEVGIAVTEHRVLDSVLWWLFPSGWHSVGEEYAKFGYYLVRYHSPSPPKRRS
jgi:uncharacterized SAM-binding protein YcdF (DUF218 family)